MDEQDGVAVGPTGRRRLARVALLVFVTVALISVSIEAMGPGGSESGLVASAAGSSTTTASTQPPTSSSTPTTSMPPTTEASTPSTTAAGGPATTARPTTTRRVPPELVFRATNGPLAIEVTVSTSAPVTGQLLRFTTKVTDSEGGLLGLGSSYGDEGSMTRPNYTVDCAPGDGPSSSATTSKTFVEERAYRVPGVYEMRFEAVSAGCGRAQRRVSAGESIGVSAGDVLSNGPNGVDPVAFPQETNGGDPALVHLSASAMDVDGFVREVVVDWGDGTPASVITRPLSQCVDPRTTYPSSSAGDVVSHDYASSGSKTITISAMSSGCDGGDEQRAESHVVVPAP